MIEWLWWQPRHTNVYLEDGAFLNAEISRQRYGFAYTRFPFKYLEEFRKLEREAREAGKGLWRIP